MNALNRIRNPRLSLIGRAPGGWHWLARGDGARWSIEPHDPETRRPVMTLECLDPASTAAWSQRIRAKAGQWYRLEADVRVDGHPAGSGSGLTLSVSFDRTGEAIALPAICRSSRILTLRGYFQMPPEGGFFEVRIGLAGTTGRAWTHELRLVPVLEPDEIGHVLAAPPPPSAYPPPLVARRVAVSCDGEPPASLMEMLRLLFTPQNLVVADRHQAVPSLQDFDSVLVPGRSPPQGLNTLRALEAFAVAKLVVISPQAFLKVARSKLKLRRIDQPDDPLNARVQCGCFITRGFALHDVFPFSVPGKRAAGFAQDQFCSRQAVRDFCKQRGYVPLLSAVTDSDRTSNAPIALWKETRGGALIVCDLAPLQTTPSILGEAGPAARLLLNMLGFEQTALGRYVTPARSESQFRRQLADLTAHYPLLEANGFQGARQDVTSTAIQFAQGRGASVLQGRRRPAVLVRTGLRPGDENGVYGAMLWLKRLVRPAPHACPSAAILNERLHVVWMPMNRPWSRRGIGFELLDGSGPHHIGPPTCEESEEPKAVVLDNAKALIDLTRGDGPALRIVFARRSGFFARCAAVIPALLEAVTPPFVLDHAPEPEAVPGDWKDMRWRVIHSGVRVEVDEPEFGAPLHREALARGSEVIRIELPAWSAGLAHESARATDLAALTLDLVLGQLCNTVITNHAAHPIRLDPTLVLGESCGEYALRTTDPVTGEGIEQKRAVDPGQCICLAPGEALRTLC